MTSNPDMQYLLSHTEDKPSPKHNSRSEWALLEAVERSVGPADTLSLAPAYAPPVDPTPFQPASVDPSPGVAVPAPAPAPAPAPVMETPSSPWPASQAPASSASWPQAQAAVVEPPPPAPRSSGLPLFGNPAASEQPREASAFARLFRRDAPPSSSDSASGTDLKSILKGISSCR